MSASNDRTTAPDYSGLRLRMRTDVRQTRGRIAWWPDLDHDTRREHLIAYVRATSPSVIFSQALEHLTPGQDAKVAEWFAEFMRRDNEAANPHAHVMMTTLASRVEWWAEEELAETWGAEVRSYRLEQGEEPYALDAKEGRT